MDKQTFGKKTSNGQRPRVDRFVAPRESFPEISRRLLWSRYDHRPDDVQYSLYKQQKKHMKVFDEAFGLEPLKAQNIVQYESLEPLMKWPCIPRKSSYLSSKDSVLLLDLPTYREALFPELLDWSNNNILVAALGKTYHMWSWQSQNRVSQGVVPTHIFCCKFDPRGELLLLGTKKGSEVHNNSRNKCISANSCIGCVGFEKAAFCYVTAMDWSPTGNSFVVGCTNGMLCSYTRSSHLIAAVNTNHITIFAAKVSPDARFVATAYMHGNSVGIWSWPELEEHWKITLQTITKALVWHPWRSALLGIGCSPNIICLWSTRSTKGSDWNLFNGQDFMDGMLFSHRTGELVLNVSNRERVLDCPRACSQLLVMSEPGLVVDNWGDKYGLSRVRTMVFSPDGTKLATATADEDLIIFNFLPEDDRNIKRNYCRFSNLPMYLDEAAYGTSKR